MQKISCPGQSYVQCTAKHKRLTILPLDDDDLEISTKTAPKLLPALFSYMWCAFVLCGILTAGPYGDRDDDDNLDKILMRACTKNYWFFWLMVIIPSAMMV